jgi:hypothetical protein
MQERMHSLSTLRDKIEKRTSSGGRLEWRRNFFILTDIFVAPVRVRRNGTRHSFGQSALRM